MRQTIRSAALALTLFATSMIPPAGAVTVSQRPPAIPRRGHGRFVFVACPGSDGAFEDCGGQSPHEEVMQQRGASITQLTGIPSKKWSPVWSPDFSHVAYTSTKFYATDGDCPAFSRPLYGSQRFRLKSEEFACVEPVDWSPGGRWILMIAWYYEGGPAFYRVHPDGTELHRLTCFFEGGPSDGHFFHGGKRVIFSGTKNYDDKQGIYTMRSRGGGIRLVYEAVDEYEPYDLEMAPDRKTVVFETEPKDESAGELYSMELDGSGLRQLTHNEVEEAAATFSPDGSKLAFATRSRSGPQPFVLDLATGVRTRLAIPEGTRILWSNVRLVWSPDGTKVAYAANKRRPNRRAIYWSDVRGKRSARATDFVRALDLWGWLPDRPPLESTS